jgi:hypothetical protein
VNDSKSDWRFLVIALLGAALLGGLIVVISGRAYTGSGMRLIGAATGASAVVVARLYKRLR